MTTSAPGKLAFPGAVLRLFVDSTAGRLRFGRGFATLVPTKPDKGGSNVEQQNFELNKQAFGSFLAQLRREKGWTQKDLAERLYVSDKAVSKWERGESLT